VVGRGAGSSVQASARETISGSGLVGSVIFFGPRDKVQVRAQELAQAQVLCTSSTHHHELSSTEAATVGRLAASEAAWASKKQMTKQPADPCHLCFGPNHQCS